MIKTRFQIIDGAKRLRAECIQIVADAEHWNKFVRKSGEPRIDPDPNGELARTVKAVDRMLANEIRICEPPTPGAQP